MIKPNRDVLRRFLKDQAMPFSMLEEPYFSHYLDLYEEDYHSRTEYEKLLAELQAFGSCEAFLDEYYRVRDALIKQIKDTPAYEQYNAMDMQRFAVGNVQYPGAVKQDIYRAPFIGRRFISIDLVKANFQVLSKLDPALVNGAGSYGEMVMAVTKSAYIARSKYTRQVIFGNMNPKRQVTMERYYTHRLLEHLIGLGMFSAETVAVFTYDEIVLFADALPGQSLADEIREIAVRDMGLDVHVQAFRLRAINNLDPDCREKSYYLKEHADGTVDFKGVPGYLFSQVYKAYKGMPLVPEMDLVFSFEHFLAMFKEPLFKYGFSIVP